MALNVPPIGTRGLYSLKAPFTTVPNELYTCAAIRYFKDVQNQGIDVFKRYYEPYELDVSIYSRDLAAGVVIVTLISDSHPPIYIPSSYITSFPGLNSVNYHHVVLSMSLGPLPETLDLTFLKTALATVASDVIGVEPVVFENVADHTGAITPEEHDALTAAREAAVSNRTTDYARVLELTSQNAILQQKLQILEQLIISKGLLD